MANFDLRSWLTGYIFSVVGKELKLPVLEHPAVQWRLSPSIITTDGAEADDRVWGFSNIDDEFLLVTTSSSKLYQSYDGISWNYVADIPFSYTNDIMRVNGVYYNVPTYSKTMYYSEDLIIWTACSFPTNHPVNTVKSYQYSAGKFICTSSGVNNGTSGTYLYYSNDGKSWYAKFLDDSPYSSSSRWGSFSVNYYPEIDIWLGIAAVSDNLYYSTDGISWYYAASNVTYTPKYNNGVFLYFSRNNDANPRYHKIYKSEDGKKWRCVYHEDLDESVSDYASLSFTCLNDIWYMSSDGLGTSFRSVDNAETWEPFDELPDVYDSVTAFGKLWLSNYSENRGLVSVDGESWDTITDARITSAAIDKDFALDGVISYSTDGINWYDTNVLTIKQEMPSGDTFGNESPIKFKNVWVSLYYKSMGNLLDRKYYESRLLYLPVPEKQPTAYSYNGDDFGGSYRTKYVSNNGTTEEWADFGVGEFPLAMSTYMSYAKGATQGSFPFTMNLTELPDSFSTGQKIEIRFYFPTMSITYASDYTVKQSLALWSKNADGETVARGSVSYDTADGEISYSGEFSFVHKWADIFDSDMVLKSLSNDSGEVIGFYLTGTLLYDVSDLSLSEQFSYDTLSSPPSGYCYVTFNSVDDLQITVYK